MVPAGGLMGEAWSVNAMGVMGVLARVDDRGNELESVSKKFTELIDEGASVLVKNGRNVLAGAWESACSERSEVPEKLMSVVEERCHQVTEATVAIVTGDAEMGSVTTNSAEYALEEWGIHSSATYTPLLPHAGQ